MDANTANFSSNEQVTIATEGTSRTQSFSQQSDGSQTAAEIIDSQLQLEADAREALPYKFDNCTKTLGTLRQIVFSCITCNPPPTNPSDGYKPAGVCYSCSIQCHGDHTLVELFNKREFVCDCGTTRLPSTSPCTLRLNPETNTRGGVHSEMPELRNKYNQNFQNRFCGCECDYDAHSQKGTMFQCFGLGTAEDGGCGEDWWHPGCIVGLGPDWYEESGRAAATKSKNEGLLESITEVAEVAVEEQESGEPKAEGAPSDAPIATVVGGDTNTTEPAPQEENEDDDPPLPPGFPEEDDFDGFICYKCVEANPWIKNYAGTPGFLGPVFRRSMAPSPERGLHAKTKEAVASVLHISKKREADDDEVSNASGASKRVKVGSSDITAMDTSEAVTSSASLPDAMESKPEVVCKVKQLSAPTGQISIFFKSDFRDHLCRCTDCFPDLKKHNQLLEEEETYEPEISEHDDEAGGSTVGSGSIYDRGESALKNVDRVRAIEGVMAYNHLKDKLKPFFQQFAASGKAISAEDIKAHFAKMRGDEQAMKEASEGAVVNSRKEQSGY
ncbi:metaphase-anaphase transition protein-like protein mlo2 [Amylocarpus encephaloides]|uniref:Metaphase-anaphase transition protein-like protein mlo2 n=1 Tax=Amylocarpus encephaloides TaxID=45428 RepID=A0A9P8C363_9HELO|nr:metaphase-anaphase transition protein-like protein mlo2 [Amylocarpus encephaloides]